MRVALSRGLRVLVFALMFAAWLVYMAAVYVEPPAPPRSS